MTTTYTRLLRRHRKWVLLALTVGYLRYWTTVNAAVVDWIGNWRYGAPWWEQSLRLVGAFAYGFPALVAVGMLPAITVSEFLGSRHERSKQHGYAARCGLGFREGEV